MVSAVVISALGISLAVDSVANCGFKQRVMAHTNVIKQISSVISMKIMLFFREEVII